MTPIRVGSIEIVRIQESCEPAAPPALLPSLPPSALEDNRDWLSPTFFDFATQRFVFSTHTWLIRTPRYTVLFELGAGNGKHRPNFPRAHMLTTPWLDRLAAAGVKPRDVDFVVASHLHTDHVGWFTSLEGSQWVPTFPNAKYLIPKLEFDNWTPGKRTTPVPAFNEGVIEDSVLPVVAAGQVELVEEGHQIDSDLAMLPARGHTIGHIALLAGSGSESAVLSGDIAYSPLQFVYPSVNAYADEDMDAAIITRKNILDRCAESNCLLLPSHFADPYSAVRIGRSKNGYIIRSVAGETIAESLPMQLPAEPASSQ